jgi:SAM-dependent methyltransferase
MHIATDHTTASSRSADHHHHPGAAFDLLAGLTMLVGRRGIAETLVEVGRVVPGDRVVDIGCGPGVAARTAARHGATVIGVDPSSTMLRLARLLTPGSRAGGVTFRRGTAAEPGLADVSATVAWAASSAHHWPGLDAGVEGIRRILEIDGRLVILERVTDGRGFHGQHGFSTEQLDDIPQRLETLGFADVHTEIRRIRRGQYVVVRARRAP